MDNSRRQGSLLLLALMPLPLAQARAAQDLLPAEIWESILRWIGSDDKLLAIGGACTTFSALCVRIYLQRHAGSGEDLWTRDAKIRIRGHTLWALALCPPCASFPAETLICGVGTSQVPRQLRGVRNLVAQFPNLTTLSINFAQNLFSFYPLEQRSSILRAFCSLMSQVASRIGGGPVFVLSEGRIVSYLPEHIAMWRLELYRDRVNAPSLKDRTRRFLSRTSRSSLKSPPSPHAGPPPNQTEVRYHDGTAGPALTLLSIHSASLQRIPGPNGASLLTLNASSTTALHLGHPDPSAVIPHIASLLPLVHIDRVRTLYLHGNTHIIASGVLSAFLAHHPGLSNIEFISNGCRSEEQPVYPVAHPGLKRLKTAAPASGGPAPDLLLRGLVDSPGLCTFEFTFRPSDAAWVLRDLRLIAARPRVERDVRLTLSMTNERADNSATSALVSWVAGAKGALPVSQHTPPPHLPPDFWADTPAALAVAHSLRDVHAVAIISHSLSTPIQMLRWLAALPELTDLSFVVLTHKTQMKMPPRIVRAKEEQRLVDEARTALPSAVREIRCEIY